jgi:hypothetical protein
MQNGNGEHDGGNVPINITKSRRAENLPLVQVIANASLSMNMHALSLWEMARQLSVLPEPIHPMFVEQLADRIGEAKDTLATTEMEVRAHADAA